jgi:hypothetical protein
MDVNFEDGVWGDLNLLEAVVDRRWIAFEHDG